MTLDIAIVLSVIIIALVLFITERYPIDQVALAIPVVLLLTGILTTEQAVAGFSHTGTVTVGAMLIMSLGLVKTGVVTSLANAMISAPVKSPYLRLIALCLIVSFISPFLNNTAVVVIFIPVFLALAQTDSQSPSRYMIPLSYAAILGGTVTMIGTSTNLVVYGMAKARGYDDLSMFAIAPIGLLVLAVGLAYLFTVGRWLLPDRPGSTDLSRKYNVRVFVTELLVTKDSPIVNSVLSTAKWANAYSVTVLGIGRAKGPGWQRKSSFPVKEGDLIFVQGETEQLLLLADKERLAHPAERGSSNVESDDMRMVELLVGPDCPFTGQTLAQTRFRWKYGATVIAIQSHGLTTRNRLGRVRLRFGDMLLVHGPATALDKLADEPGLIPLGEVEKPITSRPKAFVAVSIMVGVVSLAGLGILPIMTAAITGVVLLLFTGCIKLHEIYSELDWMVVFTLAGLIPLGIAMDESGAANWLGMHVARAIEPMGPVGAIAGLYFVTSMLTEVMANVATAVMLTPVALLLASELNMNPYALIVAVMFGASASFMTPMGYQTNTLVYGPGNYKFTDYLKVGLPLNLILLVVVSLLIPIFWPS